MWIVLSFISAVCLGCYDICKKIALRENAVLDVLTLSVCVSAVVLSVPLVLSRCCPEMMMGTVFFVPELDMAVHVYVVLKSLLVLSSWVFAYMSLKHLPLSVVSPLQATRPMWTLVGAMVLFGERLNGWQWVGVLLALGSILQFTINNAQLTKHNEQLTINGRYYVALGLAILLGACSGLYDKYLMRSYDHNAVQVYYTMYQAVMMVMVWIGVRVRGLEDERMRGQLTIHNVGFTMHNVGVIVLISLFLIVSDNVYMLALRDPESLIAVVSTIRRGGAVIGFGYGLVWLKESDPLPKLLCMFGILAGLICLAIGSV